jgi:thymidylate synthase
MEQQISRQPFEFPTIEIINKRECINDYVLEDFKINNYQSHDQIKGTMRA